MNLHATEPVNKRPEIRFEKTITTMLITPLVNMAVDISI